MTSHCNLKKLQFFYIGTKVPDFLGFYPPALKGGANQKY